MLTDLSIKNVVLIDTLNLEFNAGLTALTGETGAGKSIVLDALGMATGARSDRGLVRAGTDKAHCSAQFEIPLSNPVWAILEDADIDCDTGGALILRRVLSKDGRSKAYINDASVSVKLLSEVGRHVLEVHGQHDGRSLMDVTTHINLLDQFGGYAPLLDATAQSYKARESALSRVTSLTARQAKAAEDRDFFEHSISEIDRLDPKLGEEDALVSERRFLQGAEGALAELSAAEDALGESGAFEERLGVALAGIERVQNKLGDIETIATKALKSAAEALERAMLETQEARQAVSDAAASFEVEPGQLDVTEKRLFALRAAARKFDTDIVGLLVKRTELAEQLTDITSLDRDIKAAKAALSKAEMDYQKSAQALTKARKIAAKKLSQSVMAELPPLKMERAHFQVSVTEGAPTSSGQDSVMFEVSTNPGSPIGPLDKIASGGEMARFALALKVALSGNSDMVMVFDEVDQGVGGAVADAVGKRLKRLAENAQVFVVTHSAQVAASAAHQFRIEKSSDAAVTTTHVCVIADDEREEEIARMLSGEVITNEARAAARQLMAS